MSASPSSSTRLTYLPSSYFAALAPDSELTLGAIVEAQDRLADEAKEVLPYAFDECSFDKGYLRQNVWSCIDCGEIGVCYGCSISCHSEHKLVELLTRRHFRCDCPAEPRADVPRPAKRQKCTLSKKGVQLRNEENRYGKNFSGEYCRCGRAYDPETEEDGMLCCIACEDWLHETCINLRQPAAPKSRPPTRAPSPFATPATAAGSSTTIAPLAYIPTAEGPSAVATEAPALEEEEDDEADLLLPSSSYDGLICAACVRSSPLLRARAGTRGWMVIEPAGTDGFVVLGKGEPQTGAKVEDASAEPAQTTDISKPELVEPTQTSEGDAKKRSSSEHDVSGDVKRRKMDGDGRQLNGKGDVFLAHGVRDALKVELSTAEKEQLPFPLDDEEIYEPRRDTEPEETLEDVTERLVGNMPRVQAIEALHGYQRLKERLTAVISSRSGEGQAVSKEDIEAMFESLRGSRT